MKLVKRNEAAEATGLTPWELRKGALEGRYPLELRNLCVEIEKNICSATIMLFGSRSNTKARIDSDLDIIIVSDSFKYLSQYIRKRIFSKCFYESTFNVDAICMTRNEFLAYKQSNAYEIEKPIRLYGEVL